MSRRICGRGRDVVQPGRVTASAPLVRGAQDRSLIHESARQARENLALGTHFLWRRGPGCGGLDSLVQFTRAGRHPAARASLSLQNQRSPFSGSMRTLSYQGLHGM